MRLLKHGFLNLVRRPTKAVMIFVILFVVFSLVFTGVIVQNSIGESRDYIRREIGGAVEYKIDYMRAYADDLDYTEYEDLILSLDIADEMSKDSMVKGVFVTEYGYVDSDQYKMAKEPGEDDEQFEMNDEFNDYAFFTLKGTKDGRPLGFEQGNLKLTEGQMIDRSSDKYSIMISENLAERNDLAVGDSMSFMNYSLMYMDDNFTMDMNEEDFEVDLKIVGLFEVVGSGSVNEIYTTFDNAKEFSGSDENTAGAIYFLLDDPLNVDTFIEKHTAKLPSEYMVLDAGDSQYEELTKPLDLMEVIASILIWVIFIAGSLITIAIVTIFVRDRKFEVGLLLSSGESKGKIVLQFITEILAVAVIAFVLSLVISNQTSGIVSNWIIENQLVEDENANVDDFFYYNMETQVHGDVSMEDVADEFDAALSTDVIVNLSMVSAAMVLFAASIPLIIILSYKPRRVLQD